MYDEFAPEERMLDGDDEEGLEGAGSDDGLDDDELDEELESEEE